MPELAQLPNGGDGESGFLATLAERTRRTLFARQAATAGKFGAARQRLIGPARADEIAPLVLDDSDGDALERLVRRAHSLP